jgi:hypothetical protein
LNLDDQLAELWAAGATFTDMARKPQTARPPLVAKPIVTAKPRPRLLMDLDWNSCRWPVTFATLSMAVSLATHAKLRSDQ